MGLLFICYQADLEQGFITVQTRLNGEPLEEYLKPVGGGYFFTLPGATGDDDFIGRSCTRCHLPKQNRMTPNRHWSRPMKKTPLALLLTLGLLNTPLAAFAATAPLDLVGPVSDYKIYVTEKLDELASHTQQFTDAVKKGDLATAQKLYAPTRVYYESIEPIAELFSDLDASIDSRVDDHEKGVKRRGLHWLSPDRIFVVRGEVH